MIKSILACAALCAAMLAAGCNRDASAGGGVEKVSGTAEPIGANDYRNQTFGLTVTAPDGWFVMDNDQTTRVMDMGVDVATAGNDRLKAMAEASKQTTSSIFMMFKDPPGTPVEFNPSVIGVAESVLMSPGVKSGKDYFFHARKVMEQSSIAPEIMDDYSTRKIGGQMFDRMDTRLNANGITVNQRLYAAKHDNHIILIVQSYKDETQEKETAAVLDSIRLDW